MQETVYTLLNFLYRWDCWLSHKLYEVADVSICGGLHCNKFISHGLCCLFM